MRDEGQLIFIAGKSLTVQLVLLWRLRSHTLVSAADGTPRTGTELSRAPVSSKEKAGYFAHAGDV